MRIALLSLLLLPSIASAKPKPKSEPAPAPPPVVEAPPPAPVEAPPAEEAAPTAPARVNNVSLKVTVTTADGTSKTMAVTGLERSEDFHADAGWTSSPDSLKITLEVGSTEKEVKWSDVKSITITPGKMPDDVDCSYNSDFNPFMYECSIRTTTTAVLKDGSKGAVNTRNKWRLTTEDGTAAEFYLFKHTERMQGEPTEDDQIEDPGMYTRVQQSIREALKTTFVKSVTVQ